MSHPSLRFVARLSFLVVVVWILLVMTGCPTSSTGVGSTTPAAPAGVTATPGNAQVTISWSAVTGATSYNLYWSTTSGVTKANGNKIAGVASPYNHTGLTNGTAYYYVVTALNAGGESAASTQVTATPLPTLYPRIVIETYVYQSGAGVTQTNLVLYDSTGAQLASSLTVSPSDPNYPSGRIDYTVGLNSGTYYIKITDNGLSGGPYVIRALSLGLTDTIPADVYPNAIALEPWPDGDDASTGNIPAAPKSISLGASNYLNRLLDKSTDSSFTPGDIDWCKLVLP